MQLNPAQRQAVEAKLGNLLILAGAGSGKTRVLVNRIAWLIQQGHADLSSIFAVTFTNKAAHELKDRLTFILKQRTYSAWVGTFHGLAHKLLRLHWRECGLPQDFQILDSDDQLRLIKKLCKQLNIDEDKWEYKQIQNFISRKKDDGIRASKVAKANNSYERVMHNIYVEYEKYCHKENLVDFGELLLRPYELLLENKELLLHYQNRFRHFLVDEFQDTNIIQYNWLKLLAARADTVTVVGDDDQSIYGWRGAKIENIHKFPKDFANTTTIRLEQNYRSTEVILEAANAVIACNTSRFGKQLWTEQKAGDLITLYTALNEDDEALFVGRRIQEYLNDFPPKDIAILYRSNAQSRVLEEALMRMGISYCIYGGVRFFERAEIKDALAYLRLVLNPDDDLAFARVINTPARGIGEQSLHKLRDFAIKHNYSYWQAANQIIQENLITGKAGAGLRAFVNIIETLTKISNKESLATLVEQVIKISGLLQFFKNKADEASRNKAENLEELVSATRQFATELGEEQDYDKNNGNNSNLLLDFLSYASLDTGEIKNNQNGIQLMTLHAAKGLEFPVVFICGVEEGLFPHHFSKNDNQALEEERRLCYVGITRAMRHLIITNVEQRRIFGREEYRQPSRFIQEIPTELIDIKSGRLHRSRGPFTTTYTSSVFSKYPTLRKPTTTIPKTDNVGDFQLGKRVRHGKFGVGTIVDLEGSDDKIRVNVHFDTVGPKWLILSLAKLEVI